MKRITLFTGLALVIFGIIARIVAAATETTVPVAGAGGAVMLQESIWTPIGSLLIFIGVVALLIAGVQYLLAYFRERGAARS